MMTGVAAVKVDGKSHLELVHRISGIVSSGLSLEAMLSELVALVVTVTECDACLVYLLDDEAGEIVLCASQLPHETEIGNIRLRLGEGVTGWVAQHQSVVALASQAAKDPRFKTFPTLPEDTYESLLSVPLVSGGRIIGVINVHHQDVRTHSVEEVALLGYVAEQMGGAIARSRLLEQSRATARRMEVLAAVGDSMTSEALLDRLLQNVSEMVAQTFDSPFCSIMTLDDKRQHLTVRAARYATGESYGSAPIAVEGSPIREVVRSRQTIVVENISSRGHVPELRSIEGPLTLLSVPIATPHTTLGVLNIYVRDRRVFTDDETRFARAVAGQAALALENDRLLAETLEMKRSLETRKVVERAKGILQFRDGMTEEEAYLHLRNESRRLRKPMRSLAEAVILAEELHRKGKRREPIEMAERALPDPEPAEVVENMPFES